MFIPEGRMEFYCNALVSGFDWDFPVAIHMLVPQFEAGLRQIAMHLGVIPRSLPASGTENSWGLERLLSDAVIRAEIGESLAFEIGSLLIDNFGSKIRHNLAHGLLSPEALCGPDAIYAWWLFLHLCIVPTAGFHAYLSEIRNEEPPE